MSDTPTVKTSEMSELLDSLTVIAGSGIPAKAMQREVMRVAREALRLHQATLAAKEQAERELDQVTQHRDALYKMAREDFVKVRDWLRDPDRKPAAAAFTAGVGRDAATAAEDSGVLNELAQLREQVRWRKCGEERPRDSQKCLAWTGHEMAVAEYLDGSDGWGEGWNINGDEKEWDMESLLWRPLPLTPPEAK